MGIKRAIATFIISPLPMRLMVAEAGALVFLAHCRAKSYYISRFMLICMIIIKQEIRPVTIDILCHASKGGDTTAISRKRDRLLPFNSD